MTRETEQTHPRFLKVVRDAGKFLSSGKDFTIRRLRVSFLSVPALGHVSAEDRSFPVHLVDFFFPPSNSCRPLSLLTSPGLRALSLPPLQIGREDSKQSSVNEPSSARGLITQWNNPSYNILDKCLLLSGPTDGDVLTTQITRGILLQGRLFKTDIT